MKATPHALLALAMLVPAQLCIAHTIDTGNPNNRAVGAYAFDSNDYYAGQVNFAGATQIVDVFTHVLGGTPGETFTVVLFDDAPSHVPGNALFSSTATLIADGWNGAAGLRGWIVAAGNYWVGFEIGSGDTLGAGSDTGALLDNGVPSPLLRTAFNAGGGYQATTVPLTFGLQLDARAAGVPEPGTMALLFGGLGALLALTRKRPKGV